MWLGIVTVFWTALAGRGGGGALQRRNPTDSTRQPGGEGLTVTVISHADTMDTGMK